MLQYIVRRLLWGVVLLIAVTAITFVLFYLLPNVDPAVLRAGRNSNPRIIKEIARLGGDVSGFVPRAVAKALAKKFAGQRK